MASPVDQAGYSALIENQDDIDDAEAVLMAIRSKVQTPDDIPRSHGPCAGQMGRAVTLHTETAQRPNRFSLTAAVSGHVNLPPLLPFRFFGLPVPCLNHAGCSFFGSHLQYPATCIHVKSRHFVASCHRPGY